MTGKIFLFQQGDKVIKMEETEYASELILQDLIAQYPDLLAGEQMDIDSPRRWLLVQKELVLPYDEEGLKLFYIDHVFLDQDGVLTLVETKRSSDNRLRREVVAQMLDYASNALIYLSMDEIRSSAMSNFEGQDMDDVLEEELGYDLGSEKFLMMVKTNLQAGKIRMIFVADVIPAELKRIVEFLNEQMDPAEVLAVEVKQYIGDGLKTVVPRLVGQTAEAQMKKSISSKILTESSFFDNLDDVGKNFYTELLDFAREKELLIKWSAKGFSLMMVRDNTNISILRGYCQLSAFGQVLFATVSSIISNVPDGESIVNKYKGLDDFAVQVSDGYRIDITENMGPKNLEKFYETITNVIETIRYS